MRDEYNGSLARRDCFHYEGITLGMFSDSLHILRERSLRLQCYRSVTIAETMKVRAIMFASFAIARE